MIAQDAIITAIIARLRAALPSDRVDSDVDFDALKASELRAVEVQLLQSTPSYSYGGASSPRDWLTRVRISCGARADAMAPTTGRASSVLLSLVDQALSADPFLGGLVTRELRLDDLRPETDKAQTATGVIQALYTCEHQTAWNSLNP